MLQGARQDRSGPIANTSGMRTLRLRWALAFVLFVTTLLLGVLAWSDRSFPSFLISVASLIMSMMAAFDRKPNVAIVVVSILISGAVADWMVRTLLLKPIESLTYWERAPELIPGYTTQRSDELGYLPNPGVHTARKRVIETDEIVYEATYSIGPDGFRINPVSTDLPIKVKAFGGSFMYGDGVDDDQTLPYFLARDMGIGVKNYAVHGFGMHQALILLEQLPPAHGGLNLVLTSPWHAFRSSCKCSWCGGTPRFTLRNGELIRDGACPEAAGLTGSVGKLLKHSSIYRYLDTLNGNPDMLRDDDLLLYLEIMRQFHHLSRKRGEEVMIAFIKSHEYYLRGTSFTNTMLQERLAEYSEYFVDVTLAATAEEIPNEYKLHELDWHPSAEANELRARLIRQSWKTGEQPIDEAGPELGNRHRLK